MQVRTSCSATPPTWCKHGPTSRLHGCPTRHAEKQVPIRRADGSTDMEVLQAVSQSALPVHDASALLLSRLMIQANAALKYMPSVIEDLLFRQRTIIQRLAKGLLLLSQGVDVLTNIDEFGDTIILFETSLRGILRGVPFAGLPVMTQLCPMIQMAQVTRFYQDVRPLLSATLSASD
ncbi:Uncharacterized protein SCF082_LOCUS23496 [Durusdinium trenchii]|uniref:Uncharacterized protein n=1 Tax=Durusdinium trenchii TaxID=1381693 RepID=A0ABP0LMG4_9DINO